MARQMQRTKTAPPRRGNDVQRFAKLMERSTRMSQPVVVERQDDITYDATVTELFGGAHESPLFSVYTDRPLMSWTQVGKYHEIMDWIGWEATTINKINRGFITYAGADGTAADSPTAGAVSDPCSPGNTIEFGKCDWEITGFGRIRRQTPARSDDHDGLTYHQLHTAHTINGVQITDEKVFDMYICTAVIVQDLHRYLIVGNKSNAGEFDGLQQLVTYNYTDTDGQSCNAMDAAVIDWGGLDMAAGVSDTNGVAITINGTAVANGVYNLYGMLEWAIRNIKIRMQYAPTLTNDINAGDAVLLMPTSWVKPFLKTVICYNYCGGDYTSDRMNSEAALLAYEKMWNAPNAFGTATIRVEGMTLIISGYDWELINNDGTADMYLLIRQSNGEKFIAGQYKDNAPTVRKNPDDYATTDGNMLLTWTYRDQTCRRRVVQMQPRLLMPAPWAFVRIQNVPYEGVFSPMSIDPQSAYFIDDVIKSGFIP